MKIQDKIAEFITQLEWSPMSKWPHNRIQDTELLDHFTLLPKRKVTSFDDLIVNNTYLFLIKDNSSYTQTSKHRYMLFKFDGYVMIDEIENHNNKLLSRENFSLAEFNDDSNIELFHSYGQALKRLEKIESCCIKGVGKKIGIKEGKIVSFGMYTFNLEELLDFSKVEAWFVYKKITKS